MVIFYTGQRYKCYSWSESDLQRINQWSYNTVSSSEIKESTCERYASFVFSEGVEAKAPGCGNCECCQPDNEGKSSSVSKSSRPKEIYFDNLSEVRH